MSAREGGPRPRLWRVKAGFPATGRRQPPAPSFCFSRCSAGQGSPPHHLSPRAQPARLPLSRLCASASHLRLTASRRSKAKLKPAPSSREVEGGAEGQWPPYLLCSKPPGEDGGVLGIAHNWRQEEVGSEFLLRSPAPQPREEASLAPPGAACSESQCRAGSSRVSSPGCGLMG